MDFKVVWTEPAIENLRQIVGHVQKESSDAAAKLAGEIITRVETLASSPLTGAVFRRSRDREIREVLCRNYRIFYRVYDERQAIEILAVWHSARRNPRFRR